jgi:DNA-binding CsgD family transcriptional regulator
MELLRQIQGIIFVLGHDSKIIYSNSATAKLCGFDKTDSMLGNDASQLPCPVAESAPDFFQQDQYVLSTQKSLTLLDMHVYANGEGKIFLSKKSPFYLDNKLVGVLCLGTELTSDTIANACGVLIMEDKKFIAKKSRYNDRSYTVGNAISNCGLSARELDCLFYMVRGKTMKETAKALSISPRTVETHVEQIKVKTQLQSRGEIVDYAISSGYLNYIPQSYFAKNISGILSS